MCDSLQNRFVHSEGHLASSEILWTNCIYPNKYLGNKCLPRKEERLWNTTNSFLLESMVIRTSVPLIKCIFGPTPHPYAKKILTIQCFRTHQKEAPFQKPSGRMPKCVQELLSLCFVCFSSWGTSWLLWKGSTWPLRLSWPIGCVRAQTKHKLAVKRCTHYKPELLNAHSDSKKCSVTSHCQQNARSLLSTGVLALIHR